jgi:aerobic carbon-monoxide dehydrogenase small subunit
MPDPVTFTVNGTPHTVHEHPMSRLLDVLRETLRLTGSKEGCGEGECGACSVLIDGELVNSCLVPLLQVDGANVTTIEGVSAYKIQKAFIDQGGAQCGICTPGMIMAALSLEPDATIDDIKIALSGNLCRCTGYSAIYRAVMKARQQ